MATRVIVKNLPKHATDGRLKDFFGAVGEITDCRVQILSCMAEWKLAQTCQKRKYLLKLKILTCLNSKNPWSGRRKMAAQGILRSLVSGPAYGTCSMNHQSSYFWEIGVQMRTEFSPVLLLVTRVWCPFLRWHLREE